VKEDDARAVIVNSSHQGHYPDEDAAKPFFKAGHRTSTSRCSCIRATPRRPPPPTIVWLRASAGRPTIAFRWRGDSGAAYFEQFPKLKLVGSHLGGGICEVIGAWTTPTIFSIFPSSSALRADADQGIRRATICA